MWRHLCCRRRGRHVTPLPSRATATTVLVAPAAPPDLVAGLPDNTRNSSTASSRDEKDKRLSQSRKSSAAAPERAIEEAFSEEESADEKPSSTPRSPSIHVEDFSERTARGEDASRDDSPQSRRGITSPDAVDEVADNASVSSSFRSDRTSSAGSSPPTRAPTPQPSGPPSRASSSLPVSRAPTRSPSPSSAKCITKVVGEEASARDVRGALAECTAPPRRQEDWEGIVRGLREVERLAADASARAPAAAWRAAARASAAHVRSLRSRVARTACGALGALFAARGRLIEPETEEAAGALLDRTADVNRFLRGDAESALARLACGVPAARAVAALARRGAAHRAAPVRAAAASALAELVARGGAARALDLPPEPRALLLRAAVELLGDASPDARAHARRLCAALAEDSRFRPLLKESLPASKYKSVEKSVDRLRCR